MHTACSMRSSGHPYAHAHGIPEVLITSYPVWAWFRSSLALAGQPLRDRKAGSTPYHADAWSQCHLLEPWSL